MTQLELFDCFEEFLKLESFKEELQEMLTIKEIKTQLKLNEWERQKSIVDNDCNRLIELNTARILLLESLNVLLETKLNQKQLVSKVG